MAHAVPRFQSKKSANVTLFWEIDVEGAVLKTRFGRVGAEEDANETERELPTPAAAEKELKRLVGVKRAEGYTEVAAAAALARAARNEELERKILAAPDDEGAWRVYADWLQSQGDPRGELAAIHAELATKPAPARRAELEDAEARLLEAHRDLLLGGELGDYLGDQLHVEWRHGFPYDVVLDADDSTYERFDDLAKALLAHPSCFALHGVTFRARGGGTFDPSLGRMLTKPTTVVPRTLRALGFRGSRDEPEDGRPNDFQGIGDVGDLDRLWPRVPALASLSVHCDHASLGKLPLPSLTSLRLDVPLVLAEVRDLAASDLRSVRELHLGIVHVRAPELAPLLALPALESIAFPRFQDADALASEIARSPALPRLRVISRRRSELSDAGAEALLGAKKKLAKLEVLDLNGCRLTGPMLTQLKGFCADTRLKAQRRPPGEREPGDDEGGEGRYDEIAE